MGIDKKLLSKESFEKLVSKLISDDKKVMAPVKKAKLVEFQYISSFDEMTDDYILTTQSAKSVAFPRYEKYLDYSTSKKGVRLKDTDINAIPEVMLIGVRPCDANGFSSLDAIFGWDYKDELYLEKYKKTTVIGISCHKSDAYCFCTSVGGHPGSTKGSDILLTKLSNGDFLAEIITEKGQKVLTSYPDFFEAPSTEEKDKNLAVVEVKFDVNKITSNLAAYFENPLWIDQSLRCIGCGACAYVCPTCACFDIQDEYNLKFGNRTRCWDSCGYSMFTIHTSGHNPRVVQSQRWRQRVMHKFSYMPDRLNVVGCVGCGRCSRACPVDMNLSEHLVNISEVIK